MGINDYSMVLDDGLDIDMFQICACNMATTLSACEINCPFYYRCDNVALANDILASYEEMLCGKCEHPYIRN